MDRKTIFKYLGIWILIFTGSTLGAYLRPIFSEDSEKISSEKDLKSDYWKGKVGFKLTVENLGFFGVGGAAPKSTLGPGYKKVGTEREYSVKGLGDEVYESLTIRYYTGETLWANSRVTIYDNNHDGNPDRISLTDRNDITINLKRKGSGALEYNFGINGEGAKRLWDKYSEEFIDFRTEFNIPQKIEDYRLKFEIRKMFPENPGKNG